MYVPLINSRLITAAIGISNSPTLRTQPSSVARLISKPRSLSRITLCRCSGVWLQYLLTTVSMTMRSLARHRSMIRRGKGAETTPSSSHDRQARFSRFVTSTKFRFLQHSIDRGKERVRPFPKHGIGLLEETAGPVFFQHSSSGSEAYNLSPMVGGTDMAKIKQFTIAVENRPGAVAEIAKALGNAKVNVLSLLGTSQGTSGTIQLVAED